MSRIAENPVVLITLLLVIVLVFGANKLPGAARAIGQSFRIFKNEVRNGQDDASSEAADKGSSDDSRP